MNDNKHNDNSGGKKLSRRTFLKALGLGTATAAAPAIVSCATDGDKKTPLQEPPVGKMTYRENPKTHEKVSILGYGMMRLPATNGQPFGRDNDSKIDQEMINKQIDYAIEHGVNYFDTSPAYCRGLSERATGIALSRHKREEFFIATKLSNFAPDTWSRVASIEMFRNSLKNLQVDYIDYLLLHSVGGSSEEMTAMEMFEARYIKNGNISMIGKTQIADDSFLALLQQVIKDAVVDVTCLKDLHRRHFITATAHRVQQQVVDVVHLELLEGVLEHLDAGLT